MLKKILGGAIGLSMLLPLAASAATVPATAVFNGQTQVWGYPGTTVQVTLRVNEVAGAVSHAIRTDILGDNQPTVCNDISNFEGAQERDVTVSITLPPNTGDYGFEAVVYSAPNTAAANALSGSAACAPSAGNTAGPAFSQSGVVHVIPNSTSSTTPVGGSQYDSLLAQIQSLTNLVAQLQAALAAAQTPAKPACPPSGPTNAVQAWLMANGYAAGFHAAGVYSPTGYWGSITASAYASAVAACH